MGGGGGGGGGGGLGGGEGKRGAIKCIEGFFCRGGTA